MIIEIKDIPRNKNIKKLTFDIEFEDGEPVSGPKEREEVRQTDGDHCPREGSAVTEDQGHSETPEIPRITTEGREKKEVPSEMRDIEF